MGRGEGGLHPSTFRRALLNLVQNARDAMPHGGILTLRGWWTAAQIHLAVDDTGQGIPAEQLPLLFTPFIPPSLKAQGSACTSVYVYK